MLTLTHAYNALNQRTRASNEWGSYWTYTYDDFGQLASGKQRWNDGVPMEGQQFEYDDIGNRTATQEGGNSIGASLRGATWNRNTLN